MSTRPALIGFETRLLAELRQVVAERAASGALPSNPRDDFPLSRTSPKGLDRSNREINIGYRCVMAPRSIVFIGQSDFNGAERS